MGDRNSLGKSRKFVIDRDWVRSNSTDAESPLKAPRCALADGACTRCQGRGYAVGTKGALAHAALCQCVQECPACFGRGRLTDGNDSKLCRRPAPNVITNLVNAAHIPARYAEASLDRFQNVGGNGEVFIDSVRRWRQRFTSATSSGLVITGPVGVGKTYVLAAIAKELCERGMSVRFTDFFQLLGDLKAGFSEGKADAAQLAPLIEVDVLVVDELGKGRNNDFELTILDQLVCGRYNQGKTLIASTNYPLESPHAARRYNIDLDAPSSASSGGFSPDRFEPLEQRIGPRIFSRLKEMTAFMELKGDDLRRVGPGL